MLVATCFITGSCLLVLAGVVLIPYERTCIEVLAGAWLLVLGCWCLVAGACCITGSCLAGAWLLVLGCLLLVLAALQVRALLVLACVILIPYERTRIEVLTGACCITGSCLAGACLCDTDTLRTYLYRSTCFITGSYLLMPGSCALGW